MLNNTYKKIFIFAIMTSLISLNITSPTESLSTKEYNDTPFDRNTLYVGGNGPNNYTRIQDAINDANNGDTVLVMDGLYTGVGNRDLDFAGKAIIVRSKNGPDNCIIDCEANINESHRGFYFNNNEDENSVIQGFTIQNGYVPNNPYNQNGGAIYCMYSSPTITDNVILENYAWNQGGGICLYYSNPKITYCNFSDNEATYSGAGIFCYESEPTISYCTFYKNSAGSDGGGISFCSISYPIITNCNFSQNSACEGGGIFIMYAHPIIKNSLFQENSATGYGGGGGIQCRSGNPTITNCTITRNEAFIGAGGINFKYPTSATITNCILWDNDPLEIYAEQSNPVVTYSDVKGSWPGTGNINANPLFIDPDHHDYHLQANSPCIDTGNPDWVDQDGSRSDMGAFPFNKSLNTAPNKPTIDGTTSGKPGVKYQYTFITIDPNGDDVYYWIEWGDNSSTVEWIGPYPSDQLITVNHTFNQKGTFTIRAKAKDVLGAESDWGYLEVTMPKNQNQQNQCINNLVLQILGQMLIQQKNSN